MSDSPTGSATVIGNPTPSLRADGSCLSGTLRSLGRGAKPMSSASVEKIKADALALLGKVVGVYAQDIADGEGRCGWLGARFRGRAREGVHGPSLRADPER